LLKDNLLMFFFELFHLQALCHQLICPTYYNLHSIGIYLIDDTAFIKLTHDMEFLDFLRNWFPIPTYFLYENEIFWPLWKHTYFTIYYNSGVASMTFTKKKKKIICIWLRGVWVYSYRLFIIILICASIFLSIVN